MTRTTLHRVTGLSLFAFLVPIARPQATIFDAVGLGTQFLVDLGDVDGDGASDFAVSLPGQPVTLPGGGTSNGAISARSGASGAELWLTGADPADPFGTLGRSLTGIGDLDGDGIKDLAVTQVDSPGYARRTIVQFVSGRTGARLGRSDEMRPDADALPLVDVADADGDGLRDVLTFTVPDGLACLPASFGTLSCSLALYSSGTGAKLAEWDAPMSDEAFGLVLAEVDDVDGGGVRDYAVRMVQVPSASNRIRIVSAESRQFIGRIAGFGSARPYRMRSFTDLDGDGLEELAIVESSNTATATPDVVRLVSIPTGTVVRTLYPSADVGSLARFPDHDGDGVADLLVGLDEFGTVGIDPGPGAVEIHSGATGTLIGRYVSPHPNQRLGVAVLPMRDLDGDGRTDLLASGSGIPTAAPPRTVALHSSAVATFPYCTFAWANSSGEVSSLSSEGTTSIARGDFVLVANDAPPDSFGFFVFGDEVNTIPNPGGGQSLCIRGSIGRLVGLGQIVLTRPDGSARVPMDVGTIPFVSGSVPGQAFTSLYFQFWHRDASNGSATSILSNGLAVQLLP